MKVKFVKCLGYESYNTEQLKKEHKQEAKMDEEETVEEHAPVLLVTHVNNIMHSICSIVELYNNSQQIHNSNGLSAHKSFISNNLNGAISEYKRVLHCEGYDSEEFCDENMEELLSEPFFHRENENA